MPTIIKNNGDSEWVLAHAGTGVEIASGASRDLETIWPASELSRIAQLVDDLGNSQLALVVNDGTKDLTHSGAIWHIFRQSPPIPLSSFGNIPVESRKPTGGGAIRSSHDYCDPTSWYGDSIRVFDEVLGCPTQDGIHFRADYKYWIDLTHGKITGEDDIINDTASWPNGPFTTVVEVNGEAKIEGVDYLINYVHGEVDFSWPNPFNCDHQMGMGALAPTDVVTATYNRSAGSTWYLRPTPGKILLIADTELQFSQNNRMKAPVVFAAWVYYPGVGMIPAPGETTVYKRLTDLINEGNKGTGTIAAMGGDDRGIRYPVSVFPFDYLSNRPLASSMQAELRTAVRNDIPMDGTYATVTCYCLEIDDPDYVG